MILYKCICQFIFDQHITCVFNNRNNLMTSVEVLNSTKINYFKIKNCL